MPVVAGQTLQGVPDIGLLLLTTRDGRPVYVRDVAKIVVGGKPLEQQVWQITKDKNGELARAPRSRSPSPSGRGPTPSIIASNLVERLEQMRGTALPEDIDVQVTRNYGATASEKADELLFHLALATVSIVLLIVFAIGWREGIVVAIVIPTTILLTLFASWIMGYTINRVSLFALIFSIGILVDDAIVVIENMARHWGMHRQKSRMQAAIEAVAEVGNPTIFATLTVVVGALADAVRVGPHGAVHEPHPGQRIGGDDPVVLRGRDGDAMADDAIRAEAVRATHQHEHGGGFLARAYVAVATAHPAQRASARSFFLLGVGVATLASLMLFWTKSVTVKLLPFDNKSEVQVVVDLPKGALA